MLTRLSSRWTHPVKPLGWYWGVSLGRGRWWPPVEVSSLDFRPDGNPFREWFFCVGPLVVAVGWNGSEADSA